MGSYSLMGTEFQFWKMERLLEMDSGDVCTTMGMYLILLSCTLKNAQEGKKKKKVIRIAKEEVKLPLFADDTILYTEKPRLQKTVKTN